MQGSFPTNQNSNRIPNTNPQYQQFQPNSIISLNPSSINQSQNQANYYPQNAQNVYPSSMNRMVQRQLGQPSRANIHQSFQINPQQRSSSQNQPYSMSPVRPLLNSLNQYPQQINSQMPRNQSHGRFISPGIQAPIGHLPQKTMANLKGRIFKFQGNEKGRSQPQTVILASQPPNPFNQIGQNYSAIHNVSYNQSQNASIQINSANQINSRSESPVRRVLPPELLQTQNGADQVKNENVRDNEKSESKRSIQRNKEEQKNQKLSQAKSIQNTKNQRQKQATIQEQKIVTIEQNSRDRIDQQRQSSENRSSTIQEISFNNNDLRFNNNFSEIKKEQSDKSQGEDSPKDRSLKLSANRRIQRVTSQAFPIENQNQNQSSSKAEERTENKPEQNMRPVEIESRIQIRRMSKDQTGAVENNAFYTRREPFQNGSYNDMQTSHRSSKNEKPYKVMKTMTKQQIRQQMYILSQQLGIPKDNRMTQSQAKTRKKLNLKNIISYRDLTRLVQKGFAR